MSSVGDLHDFLDGLDFADEALWRRRQALAATAGLDEVTIEAHVGFLHAARLCFAGPRFDLDIRGVEPVPAFVIGALDPDERMVDAVAWPIGRPATVARLLGRTAMLGEAQIWAQASAILAPPLPVRRSAEGWLRAGFVGCVPIDAARSARILLDVDSEVLAEDDAHGVELDDARRDLLRQAARIVVADMRLREAA